MCVCVCHKTAAAVTSGPLHPQCSQLQNNRCGVRLCRFAKEAAPTFRPPRRSAVASDTTLRSLVTHLTRRRQIPEKLQWGLASLRALQVRKCWSNPRRTTGKPRKAFRQRPNSSGRGHHHLDGHELGRRAVEDVLLLFSKLSMSGAKSTAMHMLMVDPHY